MAQDDGPVLEAIKGLSGQTIHLPTQDRNQPDRDRLAPRFELYRAVA